jgi:hypothetical protein
MHAVEKQLREREEQEVGSYVYFLHTEMDRQDYIRIGFSSSSKENPARRINQQIGTKLIAAIPGSIEDEKALHAYFTNQDALSKTHNGSTSHYAAEAVRSYVDWLIKWHYATAEFRHMWLLSRAPYKDWRPESMTKPRGAILFSEPDRVAKRDTWQSPAWIFEKATEVFGRQIDLDPCSELEAYNRPKPEFRPRYFYTKHTDGLAQEWFGNVFLNPPYGEGEDGDGGKRSGGVKKGAQAFTEKLLKEVDAGRVRSAICVLNLQSIPTLWYPKLTKYDPAIAIARKRIDFHKPAAKSGNGAAYGSSQNGTVFVYVGPDKDVFCDIFESVAYPLIPWHWPDRSFRKCSI